MTITTNNPRVSINDWPYPEETNAYKAGSTQWHEVSEEIYWEQLECLPPARMKSGCFAVGEPYDHNRRGAVHTFFVTFEGRYFCRTMNLKDFDPATHRQQIKQQLENEEIPQLER